MKSKALVMALCALERIEGKLDRVLAQGEKSMSHNTADFEELRKRIDAATTKIGGMIDKLIVGIHPAMIQAEVDALKSALGVEADKLEAMGVDPDDPVPSP